MNHKERLENRMPGISYQKFRKKSGIVKGLVVAVLLVAVVIAANPALGIVYIPLPPVDYPENNPWSKEKESLGEKLFFDQRLSGENDMSCGTCHQPEKGWTDGRTRARGFNNKFLERNTPTIINAAFFNSQFWDGRASSLEEQAKIPIQSPVEMNQKKEALILELESDPEYVKLFEKAFGSDGITFDNIAKAIATFERKIVSGDSPYDRYWQGDSSAMTKKAKKGMELFFGKAKCSVCHNGPFFTDNQFHNIGVPNVDFEDRGRQKVTGEIFHQNAFKTPGLRDLTQTGPYMHNGVLNSLEDVINYYDKGGASDENKSPFISPIGMNAREKESLVEFLKALISDVSKRY